MIRTIPLLYTPGGYITEFLGAYAFRLAISSVTRITAGDRAVRAHESNFASCGKYQQILDYFV